MVHTNRLLVVITAIFMVLSFFTSAAFATDTADIIIHVTGLRNNDGVVRIALFNSPQTYSDDKFTADAACQKLIVPINNKEATATISNVLYGEYAIKLFHDENNSGHFITNTFGIPKVEYGFSNNARGLFGPASFDKAKFKLESKKLNMTIKVQG